MKEGMILFFGCGTHREMEMMAYIIGTDFEERFVGSATLKDFVLCIQDISHIPDDNILDSETEHLSVRRIIRNNWGEDFLNYVAKPKSGGSIHGSIWKLTEEEYQVLRYWELVDYGWYDEADVEVSLHSGGIAKCRTVCLRDGHGVAKEVTTLEYNPWLQEKHYYKKIAKQSRKLYHKQPH